MKLEEIEHYLILYRGGEYQRETALKIYNAVAEEIKKELAKEIKNWLVRKVYADGLLIPHSIIEFIDTEWGGKTTGEG